MSAEEYFKKHANFFNKFSSDDWVNLTPEMVRDLCSVIYKNSFLYRAPFSSEKYLNTWLYVDKKIVAEVRILISHFNESITITDFVVASNNKEAFVFRIDQSTYLNHVLEYKLSKL